MEIIFISFGLPACKRMSSPVRKCSFDLDFMKQSWYAWKDVSASKQRLSVLHELGNGVLAISNALL